MSTNTSLVFPRAILHVDGDSFFASCHVARDPSLRGKAVITGVERGVALSLSYEAKARGIRRGMLVHDIKKMHPDVICVYSSYDIYSMYAKRMYAIIRRFSNTIEEYSIDECFADVTGVHTTYENNYAKLAEHIQNTLEQELNMSFSVGIAPSKVLAKLTSTHYKPHGCTTLGIPAIADFLTHIPIQNIWGIGRNMTTYMRDIGIHTAYDLYTKDDAWIEQNLAKPYKELWYELRGISVKNIITTKQQAKSIQKTHTFYAKTSDKELLFSYLMKNVENACIKARTLGLHARRLSFFLKTQYFQYLEVSCPLSTATNIVAALSPLLRDKFDELYIPEIYRATGFTLHDLTTHPSAQLDLYGQQRINKQHQDISQALDILAKRYGKHTVYMGSSIGANSVQKPKRSHTYQQTVIKHTLLPKNLYIPYLGEVK